MSSPHPIDPEDPYGQYLHLIAGQAARIASKLEERVMAAETAEEEARAALAWTKVARGLRQTLALHARLNRERQAYRRDFGPQIERDHAQKVSHRLSEVHNAIQGEIYTEYEKPDDHEEAGFLIGELFDILDEESRKPAFLDEPVALQIQRIRHLIGLDAPRDDADAEAEGPDAPSPVAADSS